MATRLEDLRRAAAAKERVGALRGRNEQKMTGFTSVALNAFLHTRGTAVTGKLMMMIFENDLKTKFSKKHKIVQQLFWLNVVATRQVESSSHWYRL